MNESNTLKSRLDLAAAGLRRAIEANAEAERLAARHMAVPGVAPQLLTVRAASAAAVAADTAAQRAHSVLEDLAEAGGAPPEMVLAFSSATEAVGHAADAAAQAVGVLAGLVNQRTRFERRGGRP
jgi:hypothetical protein